MSNYDEARAVLAATTPGEWNLVPVPADEWEGAGTYAISVPGDVEIAADRWYYNTAPEITDARAIVLAHAIAGPALELAEAAHGPIFCYICGKGGNGDDHLHRKDCKLAAFNAALDRALEAARG